MTPRLLALCLTTAIAACSHRGARPHPSAAAVPPQIADPALLNDVDVRLLTEALAYDVTHSPWLQGLQAVQEGSEALPQVQVGPMPTEVPPSGAPFPTAAFTDSLVQSLRNTHRVDVVTPLSKPQQASGPLWQLDVAVIHDSAAVEGDMSRGYRLDAVLRLCPSNSAAWQKSYTLRKRIRPEAHHGDTHPSV